MAKSPTLTKDEILEAAFHLIAKDGFGSLTVRQLAKALNRSTATIYTWYPALSDLQDELKDLVKAKLIAYTNIDYTLDPFLNIGAGHIAFALDHPHVYTHYFLTKNASLSLGSKESAHYLHKMKANPFLALLGDERLESLLEDMWIYTYGLATMVCVGSGPVMGLEDYIKKLEATGSKMILYHQYSSGKMEATLQLFVEKVAKHIDLKEVMKA